MPEPPANQPVNLSSFADWCKHKNRLTKEARHTVEILLEIAGTSDCDEAQKVLLNLTELHLNKNQITDITSLSALTNLTELNLGFNQITDITGLSGLTNLTELSLEYNQITDITGLSALPNLTSLGLGNNQITDITSLSALTNLTELYVHNNQITDITGLSALTNLTHLNLNSNQITDISPLLALTNLTILYLNSNQITDITGLAALTNLTHLDLRSNQITDITGLSALTNLTSLNLHNNQITDITSLSGLTNLTHLNLGNNQITDITGLWGLTNLTSLNLHNNQITDITSLSALTNLTRLDLGNNQITDITSLWGLTNLTSLNLPNNQITDITSLSGLTNLTDLHLDSNQITDITSLSGLTNLTSLNLSNNQITYLNLSRELRQNYLTLSTAPIDAKKATETVNKIYAAIGREAPQVIVGSSPQAAITLLKQLQNDCIAQHQISSIAAGNLGWGKSLLNELCQSVDVGALSPVLWDGLCQQIILEPDADRILVSEFQQLLKNDLESLADGFRSYFNALEPLNPTNLLKEIHLTKFWISKFGITLDLKAQEILRCKQQLFEDCGWIFPFENICLVCDRPLHISFDSANELHAEGEPAIAFADGYSLYFHHGVKLTEEYGKLPPDLWQAEWLLSESNAELRRVLIERIGYDRICCELQAVELDSWQEYTLLKIDNADVEPIYLLKMTCPSTGFIHALRVPPDVRSAKEAIRWVNWDIDSEEFSVQT
jgi:internalin A